MKYIVSKMLVLSLCAAATVLGGAADAHPHKHHHKHKKHHHHEPRRPHPSARGAVFAHYCPFSCSTQGIPREHCRDWRQGDVCYVEDVRLHPSASRADVRERRYPHYEDRRYDSYRPRGGYPDVMGAFSGETIGQRVDRAIGGLLSGGR